MRIVKRNVGSESILKSDGIYYAHKSELRKSNSVLERDSGAGV